MKLFYSMTRGPFLGVSSFVAKSNDEDAALKELLDAVTRMPKAECTDNCIHRVVAHSDNNDEKPSDAELKWLMVVSPRWDVEWVDTAIYYHLYGRVRRIKNSEGLYEWKLGD